VVGESVADPAAARVLPRRGRIIDRESTTSEAEVAGVHLGAGDRADESLRNFFVMPLETPEEEGTVSTVVELRNVDRTACRGAHFMVGERIADVQDVLATLELIEILAVHELSV